MSTVPLVHKQGIILNNTSTRLALRSPGHRPVLFPWAHQHTRYPSPSPPEHFPRTFPQSIELDTKTGIAVWLVRSIPRHSLEGSHRQQAPSRSVPCGTLPISYQTPLGFMEAPPLSLYRQICKKSEAPHTSRQICTSHATVIPVISGDRFPNHRFSQDQVHCSGSTFRNSGKCFF